MPFAVAITLALSALLTSTPAATQTPATMPTAQTVQQYVSTYFADAPIMVSVAKCESGFTQFDADGSVHRGVVNDKDVGVMQINEHYHAATAARLGLDIYTMQGNVAYARYLYDRQGTAPWASSAPCWSPKDEHLARK